MLIKVNSLIWYIPVVLVIYLPGSITSYFVYGKDVQSNVLFTMSAGPIRTIATVLMTLHLILGIIIVGNPVCQQIEHLANVPNSKYNMI